LAATTHVSARPVDHVRLSLCDAAVDLARAINTHVGADELGYRIEKLRSAVANYQAALGIEEGGSR
jgi:hypothetical protein